MDQPLFVFSGVKMRSVRNGVGRGHGLSSGVMSHVGDVTVGDGWKRITSVPRNNYAPGAVTSEQAGTGEPPDLVRGPAPEEQMT